MSNHKAIQLEAKRNSKAVLFLKGIRNFLMSKVATCFQSAMLMTLALNSSAALPEPHVRFVMARCLLDGDVGVSVDNTPKLL